MITDYHAKLYAHELLRRFPSDSIERFTAKLMDSRVDPNPHQVDATLFAFWSPPSRRALLADEVGLGKTIEAGIALSQKWAERNTEITENLPLSVNALETEDYIIPAAITDDGRELSEDAARRLFNLSASVRKCDTIPADGVRVAFQRLQNKIGNDISERNTTFFETEDTLFTIRWKLV